MSMLDGKVALVTGGSKGLGAATARLFAEAGARVVVTFGNDAEAADRLIASLPGSGHRASRTPAQDTRAIEALADAIGTTDGRLDILVNNAGSTRVIPHADLRALDDAFFDFVLAVNLRGPFATVRACQPLLKASGHGLVVNVGSVSGVRGGGSNIAYSVAKAGTHAMTMSLARALAPAIRGGRRRPEPDGDADDADVDPAAPRPTDRQPAQADHPAQRSGGGDSRVGDDDDLCQRHDHPGRRR